MATAHSFTFNPFQENTYIVYDETGECLIIDPGCCDANEQNAITSFIRDNGLKPVRLLNTHAHVDHIMGNAFIARKYGIPLAVNELDLALLRNASSHAMAFGVTMEPSPEPDSFLDEGMVIEFGDTKLDVVHTPGHSPGSVCLINHNDKWVIGGDVLFYSSIGRTDLPGGDFTTLIHSIRSKLFILDDDFTVYAGHGPSTTIGQERKHNPFLQERVV
ncbi:MAG: MBL fold metallo-hydrolase [Flavobacteriales bacterium]|nr:MBL fold metallo-hydrolase [Flavobacteriales bacterium]